MGLQLFPVKLKAQSDSIFSASNMFVGNSIFKKISQEIFGTSCCVVQMTVLQNTAGLFFEHRFWKVFISVWGLIDF